MSTKEIAKRSRLSSELKERIFNKYVNGKTVQEISSSLNLSYHACYSYLRRLQPIQALSTCNNGTTTENSMPATDSSIQEQQSQVIPSISNQKRRSITLSSPIKKQKMPVEKSVYLKNILNLFMKK